MISKMVQSCAAASYYPLTTLSAKIDRPSDFMFLYDVGIPYSGDH